MKKNINDYPVNSRECIYCKRRFIPNSSKHKICFSFCREKYIRESLKDYTVVAIDKDNTIVHIGIQAKTVKEARSIFTEQYPDYTIQSINKDKKN